MRRARDIILCHATSAVSLVEKAAEVSRTAPPSPAIEVADLGWPSTTCDVGVILRKEADLFTYSPVLLKHRDRTAPRSPVRRFKKSSKR